MLTKKAAQGRVIIILVGVTIALIAFAAAYHLDSSGDLAGTWELTLVDGQKLPPSENGPDPSTSFELHADGKFVMATSSGTWKLDDTNLILHTTLYDGKTKQQFHDVVVTKYPSDASMQQIAEKVFEDMKYTVNVEGSTLTANLGGGTQTYTKRPQK
jgi:hypothetical protein